MKFFKTGAQQDVEIAKTDKNINVQENLNVGGLHASGGAKIKDKSSNYIVYGCLIVAATVAIVMYRKKIMK